jgi:CPA1 family monovalent cation:H+ antiporter
MAALEFVVLIGAAVMAREIVSGRYRLSEPWALLGIGSALSLVARLRTVDLEPDIVLLLFLPWCTGRR